MKILKFYTPTCSQCKAQDIILKELEGVEVEHINCEENEELVAKYNVRALPTLVFLENEEFVAKKNGITNLEIIKKIINNEVN